MDAPAAIASLLYVLPPHIEPVNGAAMPAGVSPAEIARLAASETEGRARDALVEPFRTIVPPLQQVVMIGRSHLAALHGYRGLYRVMPKVCLCFCYVQPV